MRGSINYQVNQVFVQSGIFRPGESKHQAKEEARADGARSWSDLGQRLDIYSYGTAETYKDVWHEAAHWAKSELGVRDVEKLSGQDIKNFLESRIADGIKYSTFQKEAAALGKLENALNQYAERIGSGQEYDFRGAIQDIRQEAGQVLERDQATRAYAAPGQLIEAIRANRHQLAAKIQHQGGARLHETSLIKPEQLRGYITDKITGQEKGVIHVSGKGGKERDLQLAPETYRQLERHIEQHGQYKIDPDNYRADLKAAAEKSGQAYTGSHGLRWNYAQERFSQVQAAGYTRDQALAQTSWDMGHERPDITEHYLGK